MEQMPPLPYGTSKSNYSGRKKFIIDFIHGAWYIYKKFTIFRTLFSVESLKSERDNSMVLFISKNRRLIGSIQRIIAVEVGEFSHT